MAIQTRNSVLAIMEETTENTPVSPTASSDYVALQDDASMDPAFDVLDNAELKASLGSAKSILGSENPTFSMSHYLRHSGTEGTAPGYGLLLKASLGNEDDAGVEHDTVGGSTVSVVNVDTGEGATYRRGQALLVKDGTNGYSIRPVHSISSDALTLGFDLSNAPASGVNLGEAITYHVANDDSHPSLTFWHYLGNGGAIQMMSGGRVESVDIEFPAGELVNASYSVGGLEYYFNPIEITSSDIYLDFTSDNGTFAAQVSADFYKDPHELAAAIQTALAAADSLETFTCTYSDSTGKFTIASSTSTVLSLLWNTGTNAANTIGDKIGFSIAADDTGATSYEGDSAISLASPQSASFDSADPLVAKDNEVFIGDADDNVCFTASNVSVNISTPRRVIDDICAASGRSGSLINAREVTVSISAILDQYDADKFRRFRSNSDTRFLYNFGSKSGGNWEAGKSGCVYLPTATITSFSLPDDDGLVALEMELSAFVNDSGEDEVAISFV